MNDEFLKRYRRAPRPEFADRLYERIAPPMHTQPPRPARRLAWLTGAAMLAGVCFALLLFPPARAFADGIWHQVGAYVFIQSASEPNTKKVAPPDAGDATKTASLNGEGKPAPDQANKVVLSAGAASAQAGFAVLAPSYLPVGYASAGFMVINRPQGVSVVAAYEAGDGHGLKLTEFKLAPGQAPLPYYRPEAEDVSVRGQAGLLLPGQAEGLVWEENGITFSLVGESLSQDELMKIADGLK